MNYSTNRKNYIATNGPVKRMKKLPDPGFFTTLETTSGGAWDGNKILFCRNKNILLYYVYDDKTVSYTYYQNSYILWDNKNIRMNSFLKDKYVLAGDKDKTIYPISYYITMSASGTPITTLESDTAFTDAMEKYLGSSTRPMTITPGLKLAIFRQMIEDSPKFSDTSSSSLPSYTKQIRIF